MGANETNLMGDRIRRYRNDRNLNLSQLAAESGVSKGYLWNLENNATKRRPSAETLYAIAKALGVTIADLLGRQLLVQPTTDVPGSLARFAQEDGIPEADVQMLARIAFRGEQPLTSQRWRYIYQAIRSSSSIDIDAIEKEADEG